MASNSSSDNSRSGQGDLRRGCLDRRGSGQLLRAGPYERCMLEVVCTASEEKHNVSDALLAKLQLEAWTPLRAVDREGIRDSSELKELTDEVELPIVTFSQLDFLPG